MGENYSRTLTKKEIIHYIIATLKKGAFLQGHLQFYCTINIQRIEPNQTI